MTTYQEIHVTQLRPGDLVLLDYGCMNGSDTAVVKCHHSDQWGMHASVEILGGKDDGRIETIDGTSSKAIGWRRV